MSCVHNTKWKDAQLKTRETIARQKQARIEEYEKNPNVCLFCGGIINYRRNTQGVKFCNSSCSASYNNKKFPKRKSNSGGVKQCATCKRDFHVRRDNRYNMHCSMKCSTTSRKTNIIDEWKINPSSGGSWRGLKATIRDYLITQAGGMCQTCGWNKCNPISGRISLEIDHSDGDPYNHAESNLRVLCKNCHSLTPTYGALNRGKGRIERYKSIVNSPT